jgi:uncharacterized protein YdeI (YjbR/CyaY-like superfamily)
MAKEPVPEYYAASRKDWRSWLRQHHDQQDRVWLIIYKKGSGVPSLTYAEAVEEALCFGWIDSKANKRDDRHYVQLFARRNPKSNWSALNKERVARLVKAKQMTKAGMAVIEEAKRNGRWEALDSVDALTLPADFSKELSRNPLARMHFEAFPVSAKKALLEWIGNAKREATRKQRIQETILKAAENKRANQWKKP